MVKSQRKKMYVFAILVMFAMLLSIILLPAKALQAEDQDEEKGYLTFTSSKSFTVTPDGSYANIEYATGEAPTEATVWMPAEKKGVITASPAADGSYYIYFRGTGNTVVTSNGLWRMTDSDGAGIKCLGNIETLLDYQTVICGEHPVMGERCFDGMFSGCTSLTAAPKLPARVLAKYCYYSMFSGCTGLTAAPKLPATTLADWCYCYMFSGCTGLKEAPKLSATNLVEGCYSAMFSGCTGLTRIPTLSATVLDTYCYSKMFYNCKNLKISDTKTDDYPVEYVLTGDSGYMNWNQNMFMGTGGTFTGNPTRLQKYYVPAYYSIEADQETLSLGERDLDYTAFSSIVSIKNHSNVDIKLVTDFDCDSFAISSVTEKADEIKLSISPKQGLSVGSYFGVLSIWVEGQPQTKLTIPVTYAVKEHTYDNACDSSCNTCGYIRDAHYPVADGYEYYATYQGFDFYHNSNGDTRCYDASTGDEIYNDFKCDGTYTFYFQYDRKAMRDRLTYHPDGKHVIYFNKEGHEVFSDYGHITTSIAGGKVDDYCFFDVHGHMYVDVMTYDITGTKIYYANPYGVLEHDGWFAFSDGGYGYANGDMSLLTNQYTYDWNGKLVYMEADGHIRGTGDGRNLWPASSL